MSTTRGVWLTKLREHRLLFVAGGALIAIGAFEINLLLLGAPPLAMVMAPIVGLPMYCGIVILGLLASKRGNV